MRWTITIVRLPVPSAPLDPKRDEKSKSISPEHFQSEADALARCRELIQEGYGVEVTDPNNVLWDNIEILRRLNSVR